MDYKKLSRVTDSFKVQDSRMPRKGYDNDDNEITFREWVKQGFPTGGWNVPEESTADARKLVPFYEKQLKAKGLKENEYRVWAEASNLYITVNKEVGDSVEKPEFNDVRECIDWWGNGSVSEDSAEVEYWDEDSVDAVYIDQNTGKEATLRTEGLYNSEEEAHAALIEDMKKFGYEETDCDDWDGIYKAWFKKS